jgi:hypothetical protein
VRRFALASAVVVVVAFGCAGQAPPPRVAAAPPPAPPPVPAGANRLPASLACESGPPGGVAGAAVEAVVREHAADLKPCRDALLSTHPATEGRLVARFAISPAGTVGTSCLVRSSLNDKTADGCIVDRLLAWKFPAPAGGAWQVVELPIVVRR